MTVTDAAAVDAHGAAPEPSPDFAAWSIDAFARSLTALSPHTVAALSLIHI